MSLETRRAIFVFAVLALLYFFGLTRAGMLSTDEPRYAAIGRDMAASGDWVTPRLWGQPWFEKPPLLYWMTATATKAGLDPDLAPRLPVVLLSFGFLVFFYFWVRAEFGPQEAFYATAILGTSAGWLAYSIVAVTDLPLAATFCAALLLALGATTRRAVAAGALLGLAVLAKGLVPLVLFAPVVWHLRRHWKLLLTIAAACLVVAGPWYALVTLRNGHAFVDDFIWKHHFQRFTSDALAHVRPFWFYLPVLLAGLFPWTPVLALCQRRFVVDDRLQFLAEWTGFAFVFFSASRNKLPGYMLPLLPVIALLVGVSVAWTRRTRIPLPLAALLIGIVPIAAGILPQALVFGLSHSKLPHIDWLWIVAGGFAAGVCLLLEYQDRRSDAVLLVAVALGITIFKAKTTVMPTLDQSVSVRQFYRRHATSLEGVCLQGVGRDATYGLQYYVGHTLPVCDNPSARPRIIGVGNRLILWN